MQCCMGPLQGLQRQQGINSPHWAHTNDDNLWLRLQPWHHLCDQPVRERAGLCPTSKERPARKQ
eukprot:10347826-Alexandrium_andersonii.AAC.1